MRSTLLRRILTLVIVTLVLTASLILLVYSYTSQNINYIRRVEEYTTYVDLIVNAVSLYQRGMLAADSFFSIWNNSLIHRRIFIFFAAEGTPVLLQQTESPDGSAGPAPFFDAETLKPYAAKVLGNTVITSIVKERGPLQGSLLIGKPVVVEGTAQAAVLMAVPGNEVNVPLANQRANLFWSMIAIFILMLLPSYWASKQLVRPFNRMREAAQAMARGEYDVRADVRMSGEFGQLGMSLNTLAEQLNQTISALMLERNRLREVLDGLGEGILAVDGNGGITHTNPALGKLLGSDLALVSQESRRELAAIFQRVLDGDGDIIRMMDVGDRIMRVTITALKTTDGKVAGAVAVFRDETESERLEATRRDYVANVSHELRTPIASVRSMAEVLHDGMIRNPEDQHRYHGLILQETLRLTRLINDLLELSRLQSGSAAMERRDFSLRDCLDDIAARNALMVREKGLNFEYLPDEGEPDAEVYANPDRIEQVIVALIDNAVKYTPKGGTVTLASRWEIDRAVVWVRDTGVGISEADREHIFERFYKVDRAHTGGGTGLGLSIAREIMTRMGEQLWVESEPGRGAAFYMTIHRSAAG